MDYFKGKRTYLLAIAAIIYSIAGYVTGHIDGQTAVDMIWTALATAGIRSGVTHEVNKVI